MLGWEPRANPHLFVFIQAGLVSFRHAVVMEEFESLDEPVTLPGEWPNLLERGQIFTALLLSTSYSEWLELKRIDDVWP